MAHKHENGKGFLVIRTNCLAETLKLGGIAICDSCNKAAYTGYYIAVMNEWFCDNCFNDWYNGAKRYPEDMKIEERNYQRYAQLFRGRIFDNPDSYPAPDEAIEQNKPI